MKEVTRYLCAECWQNVVGAELLHEKISDDVDRKRRCEWCGRLCYGNTYRIFYGKKRT